MTPINLLFDASCLVNLFHHGSSRSGVFFVAYNLLQKFAASGNYRITLLLRDGFIRDWSKFHTDSFFSQFPVIEIYEEQGAVVYKRKLQKYGEHRDAAGNFLAKIWYGLKIAKARWKLAKYQRLAQQRIRLNEGVWQQTQIYFSAGIALPPQELLTYPHIRRFEVLYDTIPINEIPDYELSPTGWFRRVLKSYDRETYGFCISDCTKRDFLRHCPALDAEKLSVTYIATQREFRPLYDAEKLQLTLKKYGAPPTAKYIFSFCTLEPRKNLIFTAKCFIKFIRRHQINDLYFYLGGGSWEGFTAKINEAFGDLGAERDKIVRLGYVDDDDVNVLYSNSLFFTYISQYEGFGMPPLEAMQSGVPVITSNNSSLPEVVGDAAITVDCDSEEQILKAFADLYFNADLRREYVAKGLERAKLFSWEKTAAQMTAAMEKAAGEVQS